MRSPFVADYAGGALHLEQAADAATCSSSTAAVGLRQPIEQDRTAIGPITQQGIHAKAVDPDVPVPMIATGDIAAVAAEALRTGNWHGTVVRESMGPDHLTFAEVTRILGARLGKPDLPYVRITYDDLTATYVQVGLSPNVASTYVELVRALNDGTVASVEGRTPANTTPTRFEDFALPLAEQVANT